MGSLHFYRADDNCHFCSFTASQHLKHEAHLIFLFYKTWEVFYQDFNVECNLIFMQVRICSCFHAMPRKVWLQTHETTEHQNLTCQPYLNIASFGAHHLSMRKEERIFIFMSLYYKKKNLHFHLWSLKVFF
jgi:hypothetical protein